MANWKVRQTGDIESPGQLGEDIAYGHRVRILVGGHVDELAYGQTHAAGERARLLELSQHPIHPIGSLVHILEHDDRSGAGHRMRGAAERRQQREIAASHSSHRTTGAQRNGRWPDAARLSLLRERRDQRRRGERGDGCPCDRAVKRDGVCLRGDRRVERCDIGIAEYCFGPRHEPLERQVREKSGESVAAAHTPDGIDGGVVERPLEVCQPRPIRTREVARVVQQV